MTIEPLKFPQSVLTPIKNFLRQELARLKKTKRNIEKNDPFFDSARTVQNSLEEDVDEQIGHYDSQVKAKFLSKQIVQMRKALSRIRIGKYGICEKCGKMIDTDRLAVRPETTICIECSKEMDE